MERGGYDDEFWSDTSIVKFTFDDDVGKDFYGGVSKSDDSSSDISDIKTADDEIATSFEPDLSQLSVNSRPFDEKVRLNQSISIDSSQSVTSSTGHPHLKNYNSSDFISKNKFLDKIHIPEKKTKLTYYDTVNMLITCEPCSLDLYKSKKEKLNLLEAALNSNDGNAILAVLLFLRQTLSSSIFKEILLEYESTVSEYYLTYLRKNGQYDELMSLLLCFNRKEEAALLDYRRALENYDFNQKLKNLKFLKSKFELDANLHDENQIITEYCNLLEREINIEINDSHNSKIFQYFPKQVSLIDQSMLTMLYYCCLYHFDANINNPANPMAVKQFYHLTDKQYIFTCVKTLSRHKRWMDIEKLFINKNLLGVVKFKSPIFIERLVNILAQYGALPEVLTFYIKNETDFEKRLELAKKYNCHQVVVECLVTNRDRQVLLDYMAKNLKFGSPAYYFAEAALKNSENKWKN